MCFLVLKAIHNLESQSKSDITGDYNQKKVQLDTSQNAQTTLFCSVLVLNSSQDATSLFTQEFFQHNSIKDVQTSPISEGIQFIKSTNDLTYFFQPNPDKFQELSTNISSQNEFYASLFRLQIISDISIVTVTELDYNIQPILTLLDICRLATSSNKKVIIIHYIDCDEISIPKSYVDSHAGYYWNNTQPPNFNHIFMSSKRPESIRNSYIVLKKMLKPNFRQESLQQLYNQSFDFKLDSKNTLLTNFFSNNSIKITKMLNECHISDDKNNQIIKNNNNNNNNNNDDDKMVVEEKPNPIISISESISSQLAQIDFIKDTSIDGKDAYLSFALIRTPNRYSQGIITHKLIVNRNNKMNVNEKDINLYVVVYPLQCFHLANYKIDKNNFVWNVEFSLTQIRPSGTGSFNICFSLFYNNKLTHRLLSNPILFIPPPMSKALISQNVVNRKEPYPTNQKVLSDNNINNEHMYNNKDDLLLDENGRDMNSVDAKSGLTYFMTSIQHGQWEKLIMMIKRGVKLNCKNQMGQNEFHMCCFFNAPITVLKTLIEYKCNYMERDNLGFTGLHLATEKKNVDIVKFILSELQELIYVQNNQGLYPLHFLVMVKNIEIIRMYTACQIDIYKEYLKFNDVDDDSPFEFNDDIVNDSFLKKQILSKRDFINLPDNNGMTALHWASALGHLDICKILIPFGGINLTDNNYESCVFKASTSCQLEVKKFLESHQTIYK